MMYIKPWSDSIVYAWNDLNAMLLGDKYELVEKPEWTKTRIETNIKNLEKRNKDITVYIDMYNKEIKSNEDKINELKKELSELDTKKPG